METLILDVRFSLRKLVNNPGFSALVILTLGLGIGLNASLFSVIDAVLLRPLPYRESTRIVSISDNFRQSNVLDAPVSVPEFLDYGRQTQIFDGVAIYDSWQANLGSMDGSHAQRLQGAVVSSSLFRVLGVAAAEGRVLREEEDHAGANAVLVISDDFWKRRFNSDLNTVGKNLIIDSKPYTVVGVMPEGFYFPDRETEVWTPIPLKPEDFAESERGSRSYLMVARLRSGLSMEQAGSAIKLFAAQLQAEQPIDYSDSGWSIKLTSLEQAFNGSARKDLFILLGAVFFVLLIACANVANLLLARAARWQQEIDLRAALGAPRSRIFRQFLTESIILSLLGSMVGLLLAGLAKGLIVAATANENIVRPEDVHFDWRVLVFVLALSVLTGIVFGLAPALHSYQNGLNESLKEVRSTASQKRQRIRDSLIVSEVSLGLVLLICAGLMIQTLSNLENVRTGFDAASILTMKLYLPVDSYNLDQRANFYRQVLDRVKSLPGVQYAGVINQLPLGGGRSDRTFAIEGRQVSPDSAPDEEYRVISSDYFRTMGVPLVRGRYFAESDNQSSPKVLIVNQSMVRRYWPNSDPVGQRMSYYGGPETPLEWREIVGVVGDVRHFGLDSEPRPEVYVPYLQHPRAFMSLVLRSSSDPRSLTSVVRQEVENIDKNQAVYDITTMEEVVSGSIRKQRLYTILLGAFASLAVFLSLVGLYGSLTYLIAQQTRELGVRMALGAQRSDVLLLVLKKGMVLVLIGIVIGLAGALASTRILSGYMYNVGTINPVTFSIVPLLLGLVAICSCLVAARRALRLDPVTALRHD